MASGNSLTRPGRLITDQECDHKAERSGFVVEEGFRLVEVVVRTHRFNERHGGI